MDRRSFLGALGTGVLAVSAGCATNGLNTRTVTENARIDPADSDLSESEFREFAATTHERYGPGGVWGKQGSEPAHELSFSGAWTKRFDHDTATSEHLLAAYELPSIEDGNSASQVWLWSATEPKEEGTVRKIETGFSLPEDAGALGIYDPAQDIAAEDASEYTVESGRLDVPTLRATMPLDGGRIGVNPDTQVGDGGAYYPYWEGDRQTAQTLAATTEIRWEDMDQAEIEWDLAVSLSP